jgi:hypothetical protein
MRNKNLKKLINLQIKMISEEKYLWIFMLVLIIAFVIIQVENFSFFENENLNSIVDNITYSIIAAFIFYVLTVFYPKSKSCLKIYNNVYQNASRINDSMENTFKLFVDDVDNLVNFPERFVNKFVVKKDKEHDRYTVDQNISGYLTFAMPKISSMISNLRSRYSDYLQPEHLSQFDVIEDVVLAISTDLIKEEMSYKEVEALFLQLISFYTLTHVLLNEYKQFE